MKENILITGSNGFIGSHLIDYCINKNYTIFALDRPSASFRNVYHYLLKENNYKNQEKTKFLDENILIKSNRENLKFLECDLKNRKLLEKIIIHLKPKYIFHLGAQPYIKPSWEDPVNTMEINVIGTLNVFEPLKKFKINSRVVVACTSAEFGTTTSEINRPLREEDPLKAVHPYGISKIAAELLARQYWINFGIESVVTRFFNQTGPRRMNDVTSDFIRKIVLIELGLSEPVLEVGNLNPIRDFTDVRDTVEALWLVATRGRPGETYHVCSGIQTQIRSLLQIALSFSNTPIKVKENTSEKLRETDESMMIGDNSKIKRELGWTIKIPLEKSLKDMFDYWMDYYKKKPQSSI